MRVSNSRYVAILIVAFATFAQTKQDKIPELLLNAQFIYVEPVSGDGNIQDLNVSAEDRQAIADVTKALQKWGHYKVVMHRKDADLVMDVRVGRPASTYVGGKVGASTGQPIGTGPFTAAKPDPSGQFPPLRQRIARMHL